ncbi:MAG: hypothetical protein PWQ25_365 [Deferribacteres bacterium]|jgi:SAM-dependent methyltransferase|nr:Methyltransferase type 11 [Deferribacteraceae bacterium]MDK2791502.1 hypothetical protein [Deferribacteres bacterium]
METYEKMSEIYDEIFPFDENAYRLLKLMTNEGDSVLDIGSSTGGYVNRFIQDGYNAIGLEYTKGFGNYSYPILFGDMRKLPFKENSFDFIYSIGNTVCHLDSRRDFLEFMKNIFSLLKPKGRFLMQIINYDRIFSQSIKSLPAIETENFIFTRDYEYDNPSSLNFIGKITDKNGQIVHQFNQKLTPFIYQDIIWVTNSCGFSFVQFFGSFVLDKFIKAESFVNISCFTKP